MSDLDKKKVDVFLAEYQSLKEEERTIYSFEFSIIGIWLAFLGVLFGRIFSQFNSLHELIFALEDVTKDNYSSFLYDQSVFPDIRNTISFLALIIFPGLCSIFGLIWLDLTARFVKEGHYIFLIESNIQKFFDGNIVIGYEHFLYEETKKEKRLGKTNYMYYYLMLGLFFIASPTVVILFLLLNYHTIPLVAVHWTVFVIIEFLTVCFCFQYIRRILSYPKEKEKLEECNAVPFVYKVTVKRIDDLK